MSVAYQLMTRAIVQNYVFSIQTSTVPFSMKSAAVCPDQMMYDAALHVATVLQIGQVQ